MAKRNAAAVQTPGATSATTDAQPAAKPAGPSVAEAAAKKTAKGPVDPTKLKQPVFVEGQGWVCPAKPEQITVTDEEEAEDEGED